VPLLRQAPRSGSQAEDDRSHGARLGSRHRSAGVATEPRGGFESAIWRVSGKGKRKGVPHGRGTPKVGFPRERLRGGRQTAGHAHLGNPHNFLMTQHPAPTCLRQELSRRWALGGEETSL